MAIELSAIAAGLPMAVSFAMAGGFVALREGRRRTSLNAAMHELRRPLQVLCLSMQSGGSANRPLASSLEMAVAAVELLDKEINGDRGLAAATSFPLRPILEAAVDRWQPAAADGDRALQLHWSGDDAVLCGERVAVAQMVDNLISNSLRHGSGTVAVSVQAEARVLRLAVRDRGPAAASVDRRLTWRRIAGRSRHGHGLAIVRRTAAQHGGSFRLCVARTGTEAQLVLPLVGELE